MWEFRFGIPNLSITVFKLIFTLLALYEFPLLWDTMYSYSQMSNPVRLCIEGRDIRCLLIRLLIIKRKTDRETYQMVFLAPNRLKIENKLELGYFANWIGRLNKLQGFCASEIPINAVFVAGNKSTVSYRGRISRGDTSKFCRGID